MTDLGTLLQELGNLTAALPVLEEALAGLRAVAGPKDPQTLEVMHRLAMLHFYSRRLPRAKALLMEATAGLSETFGARHPDTLDTVADHGHLFYFEGHAAAALPLLRHRAARGVFGPVPSGRYGAQEGCERRGGRVRARARGGGVVGPGAAVNPGCWFEGGNAAKPGRCCC